MKYIQNQKILQITDQTMIVGIDIASETHYDCAFNCRGLDAYFESSLFIRFNT
ncbi:hypothetical protein REC12_08275 [Desulfosporosinus sp. PR]|uniref:hypothetical protein n=1 Tax=Candidatus Desulfosporosinus nitrosoreducens TaxID=3401928 RepID=UPI0027FEEFB8|nr:hypothetical protein [Desulfosporosinus sp. PR]MDQ7093582.1 hypothetical protein [Desulfosporosinus sp. PR]